MMCAVGATAVVSVAEEIFVHQTTWCDMAGDATSKEKSWIVSDCLVALNDWNLRRNASI